LKENINPSFIRNELEIDVISSFSIYFISISREFIEIQFVNINTSDIEMIVSTLLIQEIIYYKNIIRLYFLIIVSHISGFFVFLH